MTDYSLQKYATLVKLNPEDPEAHFGLAMAHEETPNFDKAYKEYEIATKLNARHARSFLHMGFIACRNNELDYAVKTWEKACQIDPNLNLVIKDPANARFYQKRIQEALEKIQGPIVRDPNNGHAHLLLGKAYRFFDKPEMALASLKKALDVNSRLWEAYDQSGQIYAELNQNHQAISNFQRAADANPKYADAQFNLGLLYEKEGNSGMAVRLLQRALELDPDSGKIHHALGKAYMRQGKTMLAIQEFQKAIDTDADDPKIHFALAQSCEAIYKLEFAAAEYEKAIELDGRYGEAYYQLGMIHLQTGKLQDAIEALENVVRINPADAYAYYNLAEAYRKTNDNQKAINHYYNAIGLNPKDAFAHYNLGLVYAKTNQHTKAVDEYAKAIELKPFDSHFYSDMSTSLQVLKRYDEAIKALEKTVQVNPNDTDALHQLGTAYQNSGRFDLAMEIFQKVIQLEPDHIGARYNLAVGFLSIDEADYAFEELQKVMKMQPKHAPSLAVLGQIYLRHRQKPEIAVDFLRKALDSDPEYVPARLDLADTLILLDNKAEALKELEKVHKGHEEDVPVLLRYSRALESAGRREDAIKEVLRTTNLATQNPETWSTVAEMYERNGQINLAIENYTAALDLKQDLIPCLMALGGLYTHLDKIDAAKKQYSQVLALSPDHPEAQVALEKLFEAPESRAPRPTPAAPEPERAPLPPRKVSPVAASVSPSVDKPPPPKPSPAGPQAAPLRPSPAPPVAPDPAPVKAVAPAAAPPPSGPPVNVEALFRKAVIAHGMGRKDEAQKHLQQVVNANSEHYQSYYYLGMIAKERGDRFQARTMFEHGLSLASAGRDSEFRMMFENELSELQVEPVTRPSPPPPPPPPPAEDAGDDEDDWFVERPVVSRSDRAPAQKSEPAQTAATPSPAPTPAARPSVPPPPAPPPVSEAPAPPAPAPAPAAPTPAPVPVAATPTPAPAAVAPSPPPVSPVAETLDVDEQIEMARDLLELGKVEKARAKLEKILEAVPTHPEALERMGDVHAQSKQFASAISVWEKLVELTGPNSGLSEKIGRACEEAGLQEKARNIYIGLLATNPDDPGLVERVCATTLEDGDPRETMNFLQKLLKDYPQNVLLIIKLGQVYWDMEKYSLAVVQFNKAIKIREDGDTFAALARAYEKLGKHDSALRAYENSVRLKPDAYRDEYLQAASHLVDTGQREPAVASVQSLLERVEFSEESRRRLQDKLDEWSGKHASASVAGTSVEEVMEVPEVVEIAVDPPAVEVVETVEIAEPGPLETEIVAEVPEVQEVPEVVEVAETVESADTPEVVESASESEVPEPVEFAPEEMETVELLVEPEVPEDVEFGESVHEEPAPLKEAAPVVSAEPAKESAAAESTAEDLPPDPSGFSLEVALAFVRDEGPPPAEWLLASSQPDIWQRALKSATPATNGEVDAADDASKGDEKGSSQSHKTLQKKFKKRK